MALLLTTDLAGEDDLVFARQRTRQVCALLGFESQDQTRVATALSEIARNALQYAGKGRIHFRVAEQGETLALTLEVVDEGPGIRDVGAAQDGYKLGSSPSPPLPANEPAGEGANGALLGRGITAARKLMDSLEIESQVGRGTLVRMVKRLRGKAQLTPERRAQIGDALLRQRFDSPLESARRQNEELVQVLLELQNTQSELEFMNRELEETNRGVMVLYNELEEKAETLRRTQASKNQFFSEMNHEVRTPINSILNLAELLINGSLIKPLPEQETALGYIRKSAQNLSELVDDLLDLARSEAGKLVVRPGEFTVDSLFAGLRGMFRSLHTREDVRLIFDDVGHLPPLVTDEGKVAQILRNFITNALKFTERGSVRVSAELIADAVMFSVRDTGIGIDASQHDALFLPFTQVENPHQRRVKGTGLGLSLTRALTELLNGRVLVESELGVGSTFSAIVPRLFVDRQREAQGEQPPGNVILIIDDDEIARFVLRGALGTGQHTFIEASSGAEGLRAAMVHRPRLIFLDLRMPQMNGFLVIDALKADPATRDIPVVIHTSQRLTDAEREHLVPLAAKILDKEQVQQPAGRALFDEILTHAGLRAS